MDQKPSVINSIVGYGTSYTGNIESIDLLRIDGNFSGKARSYDSILIGLDGRVKGSLCAPRIIIAGMFQGQVEGTGFLITQSTSIIIGNIEADRIIIESGTILSASIKTTQLIQADPDATAQDLESYPTQQNVDLRVVGRVGSHVLKKLFYSE